ncbi:LCP family protein [Cytobacillus horneckiae]|uniref:LCP family protein n=1 Tax=Cytobacillus horneckiae TaxID=549687 RepID=UPI003D214442
MDTLREDNFKRKKKKKSRIFWTLILSFLTLLMLIAAYAYFDYKNSLKKANTFTSVPQENYDFNGIDDDLGKTNVLLLGVDSRGEEASRSDTIMIAQYDPDTGKSKIASIMRDTYVDIPGFKKQKINAANALGGPELVRETIKANFNIDLQYYAMIDFKGFSKVIDVTFPDGIEVDVEKKMSKGIGVTLHPGVQSLNGDELLGYVRFRNDAQNDFGRVERQQEVIGKMAEEIYHVGNIAKLPKIVGTVQPFVNTNLKSTTLISLASSFLTKDSSFENIRIPVDGTYSPVRYEGIGEVLEVNLEENQSALNEFFN